ncbi:MAG: response regulator [Ferruginibacter sp.]
MAETETPGKILLIVDNSLFIIERLLSILKEVDAIEKICTAIDYTEAVTVLHEKKIGIVLLDIQLRGKNGIELLKYMVEHFPETKVIILSNLVSEYYQKLCKELGAAHFIDKSKDFDTIAEVILSI